MMILLRHEKFHSISVFGDHSILQKLVFRRGDSVSGRCVLPGTLRDHIAAQLRRKIRTEPQVADLPVEGTGNAFSFTSIGLSDVTSVNLPCNANVVRLSGPAQGRDPLADLAVPDPLKPHDRRRETAIKL
jgi:hypothetical protein